MKAVMFAAAQGSRVPHLGANKVLARIDGMSLIERILRIAVAGGVDEIIVVTGYLASEVRAVVDAVQPTLGVSITYAAMPQWEKGNGAAVMAAAPFLDGAFHILMPDHLLDPAIMHEIRARPLPGDGMRMAVDEKLENPKVDFAAVTKILHADGIISNIGKDIAPYNAVAAGVFYCTPAFVSAVSRNISERNDDSMSGGILSLARAGKAEIMEIGGRHWINVDDPAAQRAVTFATVP